MLNLRGRASGAVLLASALLLVPDAAALAQRMAAREASVATPAAALAVRDGRGWHTWWSSTQAPRRWTGEHAVVAGAVTWTTAQRGIEVGTLRLSGAREAWRFNVVLLRIDPRQVDLALHVERGADGRALPWSVANLPAGAALAINAGMFDALGPWGWVVLDGRERQAPGRGPLSSALVIDRGGNARIVTADSIPAVRARGEAHWAVQSYPTALHADGEIPAQLQAGGRGVDVEHRDARLAIGTLRDGRILIALTRFDGLGGTLDVIPFGPTLPEMTAILGALGAQRAVFLDGGVSGQMAVLTPSGVQRWEGLRRVPLALMGRAR
jgi:uncharacterized protein YigE (DUF2233 family)